MDTNSSFTLEAVLAEVSINIILFSSAYCLASSGSTFLFALRSDLFPAKAMTILGLPWRCSSLTQLFARAKESCNSNIRGQHPRTLPLPPT